MPSNKKSLPGGGEEYFSLEFSGKKVRKHTIWENTIWDRVLGSSSVEVRISLGHE